MMTRTTHIGSLPFLCINEAIEFNKKLSLPALSTLPKINPAEFMLEQIAFGIVGARVLDYKICIDKLEFVKDFKLEFLMLKEFKKQFKDQSIKWQIIGPITLMKSFESPLESSQKELLLTWYHSLILEFYLDIKKYFNNILFILDEPLFDIHFKSTLLSTLKFLENTNMETGFHCCSKLKICDVDVINPDYLSIDCALYNEKELKIMSSKKTNLISGVVNTVTGEITCNISEILKDSRYLSPACGLAFSKIKVCHKALRNLCHL